MFKVKTQWNISSQAALFKEMLLFSLFPLAKESKL